MALHLAVRATQILEKGPRIVAVGTVGFEVPEEIQTVYAQDGRILLVLYKGQLHGFVDRGELWLPPELIPSLTRHYFGRRR